MNVCWKLLITHSLAGYDPRGTFSSYPTSKVRILHVCSITALRVQGSSQEVLGKQLGISGSINLHRKHNGRSALNAVGVGCHWVSAPQTSFSACRVARSGQGNTCSLDLTAIYNIVGTAAALHTANVLQAGNDSASEIFRDMRSTKFRLTRRKCHLEAAAVW